MHVPNSSVKLLHDFGVPNLTKSEIILGVETTPEQNEIINHIILEVKYYIYVCKLEKCDPLFNRIKNHLKVTEHIENQGHVRKIPLELFFFK